MHINAAVWQSWQAPWNKERSEQLSRYGLLYCHGRVLSATIRVRVDEDVFRESDYGAIGLTVFSRWSFWLKGGRGQFVFSAFQRLQNVGNRIVRPAQIPCKLSKKKKTTFLERDETLVCHSSSFCFRVICDHHEGFPQAILNISRFSFAGLPSLMQSLIAQRDSKNPLVLWSATRSLDKGLLNARPTLRKGSQLTLIVKLQSPVSRTYTVTPFIRSVQGVKKSVQLLLGHILYTLYTINLRKPEKSNR